MTEISDSLRLLFETSIQEEADEYTITVPKEVVESGSLSVDETYRVALLASAASNASGNATAAERSAGTNAGKAASSPSSSPSANDDQDRRGPRGQRPPVEEGEVRSVTIDTLGDKGDGIAKVERGFIVIVSDTQPGDQVDVEITDVKDTVAFAEPVSEPTVR
ncbi:TRAM domain-containing protein [Halocalculus aciditolerans]|uniref:Deoxyribonuclease n=1 Tax=Halocalculus aciditolerans TaxID=1383812 RepID=A0A830FMB6_9EURY|nr:TRAM domain-containing protein [Halocalculus aciditolerans]GGL66786.1 deoxyribonuclease [Halocalculus aciditolerans]